MIPVYLLMSDRRIGDHPFGSRKVGNKLDLEMCVGLLATGEDYVRIGDDTPGILDCSAFEIPRSHKRDLGARHLRDRLRYPTHRPGRTQRA
jgi:hypothetical protein